MISIHHLVENTDLYTQELKNRYKDQNLAENTKKSYFNWKNKQNELDILRQQKNDFNKKIVNLKSQEKEKALLEMKIISGEIKKLEVEVRDFKQNLDALIAKIPNLSCSKIPIGKNDSENIVLNNWGQKPKFDFLPKPYWELEVYKKYVFPEEGVNAVGSRGYYMNGQIALFQKILFDYALDLVLKKGFELFYVPLMLNDKVLTGTGHLPDFDGQQYEIKIDEAKSFYLIGSSEPSIMGFFMNKNLGTLQKPILATCWSSCFRKEAGSYGKDQQGILRVHQFEKIEMVAICRPDQTDDLFEKFAKIEEEIYSNLGLYFRSVEVCSGDLPHKHRRQIDYEVYFPSIDKFRENCSNGDAGDFQNRGLGISFVDENKQKQTPYGLNCTAITFRTGLAIMEQFQDKNGKIKIPEVLRDRFGKDWLE
jgi:seryl-tRNA synthetase